MDCTKSSYKDECDSFLEQMPKDFLLIKADDLKKILPNNDIYLLDLRDKEQYEKDHLEGSLNCLLKELPNKYKELLTNKKNLIIVYCSGGIKSLVGGYSKFKEN